MMNQKTKLINFFVFIFICGFLFHLSEVKQIHADTPDSEVGSLTTISKILISFKLDPRLTRSLYMGDRWVSPLTYTATDEGKKLTIEAKAICLDKREKKTTLAPEWISSDQEMIKIEPSKGNEVKIIIDRDGTGSVKVGTAEIFKTLDVTATYHHNVIRVQIVQRN